MQKAILKFLATFLTFVVIFIIGKVVFILTNVTMYSGMKLGGIFAALWHGLPMDFSMAGYLTVIPGVMLTVAVGSSLKESIRGTLKFYFAVISLIVALIVTLDAVLYGYWGFKLDSTPLFYFITSPLSALASAQWWQYIAGPLAWIVLSYLFYKMLCWACLKYRGVIKPFHAERKTLPVIVMLILTAALIIPIRGGVTVSTMNLSRAYFSSDPRLNHTAINPVFSLMYSLSHQDRFDDQFRFFSDEKAATLYEQMNRRQAPKAQTFTAAPIIPYAPGIQAMAPDSLTPKFDGPLLNFTRPDIYVILLESFSSHLFPSLGGEPVATKLDSIARTGLLFTDFYANSFRTDRGIPAVFSAYPGQPTTSIMKYVGKTEHLPAFPKVLADKAGYTNTYYYGGDANFTNMKAYLVSAGFSEIISDKDFPIGEKLGKWGAHDDAVFARAIQGLKPYDPKHPRLTVVQTSSSHEPFEVPYDDHGRFKDQRARAFAFADSVTAAFVNKLAKSPSWTNSLVILVPDHYGAYPELSDPIKRHEIPLILTGGALARKGKDNTVGGQIDIAATLLSAMNLPHNQFIFSKDLLDPESPHFAVFADKERIGYINADGNVVYNLDAEKMESGTRKLLPFAQAYLQTLYNDLQQR